VLQGLLSYPYFNIMYNIFMNVALVTGICRGIGWLTEDWGFVVPAGELFELANTDFKPGLFYKGLEVRDW